MRETWKPVPEFEEYAVSNLGRVRGPHGLKSQHLSDGYCRVAFYRKGRAYFRATHLLVMAAFRGKCPRGKLVNHKDGNKANPSLSNLEYVTPKQNTLHAIAAGLMQHSKGSARTNAKLTEEKIPEIFQAVAAGESRRNVAKRYGVGRTVLDLIILRQKWGHVQIDTTLITAAQNAAHANTGDQNGMATLRETDIIPIFEAAKRGDKLNKIATAFGVSRPQISMVLHRKVWQHVAIPQRLQPRLTSSRRLKWAK